MDGRDGGDDERAGDAVADGAERDLRRPRQRDGRERHESLRGDREYLERGGTPCFRVEYGGRDTGVGAGGAEGGAGYDDAAVDGERALHGAAGVECFRRGGRRVRVRGGRGAGYDDVAGEWADGESFDAERGAIGFEIVLGKIPEGASEAILFCIKINEISS